MGRYSANLLRSGNGSSEPGTIKYAGAILGALRVEMHEQEAARNKAVYLTIGMTPDGRKDRPGLRFGQPVSVKLWLRLWKPTTLEPWRLRSGMPQELGFH
ncbi:MAG: hypothetical protein ABSE43_18320 [Steroidobacteraceae bacterium]|jgi:transposase-like protein